VRLDTRRLRKRYITACRRAMTTFAKAEKELAVHEQEEVPAYRRWFGLETGPLLTELRELEQQLNREQWVLESTHLEHQTTREPFETCYQRVVNGEPLQWERKLKEDECQDAPWGEDQEDEAWGDTDGHIPFEDEDVHSLFEDLFNSSHDQPKEDAEAARTRHQQLKRSYREICRRLHPDAGGELSGQRLELWHQAQAAYGEGDLETLDTLLAMCDMEGRDVASVTSCDEIIRITEHYRSARGAVRRLIRRARNTPGWGFLSWTDREKRRRLASIKHDVNSAIQTMRSELELIRMELAYHREGPRAARPARQPDLFADLWF
jgi:hypothetical protein